MSNPYYVWYHNKDKDLKAETMDGSDSLVIAGNGDYQEYTAMPLEQQIPDFSINDGVQLLGSGGDEGNLIALTGSTRETEPENGYEYEPQDFGYLSADGAPVGADDENIFAVQPPFAGNDLDKLFTMNSADQEEFPDPLIFLS